MIPSHPSPSSFETRVNPEGDDSEESETPVLLGQSNKYLAFVLIEPKCIRRNIKEVLFCFFGIVGKIVWTFAEK